MFSRKGDPFLLFTLLCAGDWGLMAEQLPSNRQADSKKKEYVLQIFKLCKCSWKN
jgi:hypothetical protein